MTFIGKFGSISRTGNEELPDFTHALPARIRKNCVRLLVIDILNPTVYFKEA